ncbi:MAG: glucuronyl hydrolase [Candidatus Glassbacteria bacterium]|nr:glucuronyl hydrolase [Candidatus Glassbacteria bacterium]
MKSLTVHIVITLAAVLLACGQQPQQTAAPQVSIPELTPALAEQGLAWVDSSLRKTLEITGEKFPISTEDGVWELGHDGWTGGYFAGMLWMMYKHTGDDYWREKAEKYTWLLEHHKDNADNSDICILLWPAFDLGYRLTSEEALREVGLTAARTMMKRYIPAGGYFQNWGRLGDEDQMGFVIIDCLINLDHVFWAGRQTGDPSFGEAAVSHAHRTREAHVRDDFSSYQVVEFDPETGQMLRGFHKQGVGDETTWSRGQSWGIYGFTRAAGNSGDPELLATARKMADWFIERLPDDQVPYWDFDLPPGENHPRDTSAGSMAASGMLELASLLDDPAEAERYRDAAGEILASLTVNYLTRGLPGRPDGVLTGGTYFFEIGRGVNQANIWGDFYYLEALLRWLEPDFWLDERG